MKFKVGDWVTRQTKHQFASWRGKFPPGNQAIQIIMVLDNGKIFFEGFKGPADYWLSDRFDRAIPPNFTFNPDEWL